MATARDAERSRRDQGRAPATSAGATPTWSMLILSKYFDTIPHPELMQSVARRIVDRHVLWLIKLWLKAPIEERDGERMGGGLLR